MPKRIIYMGRYVFRLARAKLALRERTAYFASTTKLIFLALDPPTIRVLLAMASFGWAFGAIDWPLPRIDFHIPWLGWHVFFDLHFQPFQRKGYELLAYFAPAWVWALLFALHGVGVGWRFYERKERRTWHLFINLYGFVLWLSMTLAVNYMIGTYNPMSALEWTMIFASGWALVMSGKRTEVVSL